MGASSPADSANDHASSYRNMREESLLRSFSAIRRSSADGVGPRPSFQDGRLKRDRRGRRGNRRVSQESARSAGHQHQVFGHAARPSPTTTSCAVTPPLPDAHDMPALPFTELRRDSSEGTSGSREHRQPRKFQRRYTPVTADFAQEMVNRLADERQNPRRSVTVTSERPSQPQPQHTSPSPPTEAEAEEQHKGFRRDYSIGEPLRHPSHMVVQPSASHAVMAADTLNKHDFAFVKRSDGSYSYAILAYRSMEQIRGTEDIAEDNIEECMVFVMTEAGSTKMIRKRHWGQLVRLVSTATEGIVSSAPAAATGSGRRSPRSLDDHIREHSVLLCREVEVAPPQRCEGGWAGWTPPSVIAFVPGEDEECSLISSVSDRARLLRRQCQDQDLNGMV